MPKFLALLSGVNPQQKTGQIKTGKDGRNVDATNFNERGKKEVGGVGGVHA